MGQAAPNPVTLARYSKTLTDTFCHPIYPELRGLVTKTSGVAAAIRQALEPVEGIEWAFLFGSTAAGTDTASSDIDLLAIGSAGLRAISPALRPLANTLGREINPHCLTPAE